MCAPSPAPSAPSVPAVPAHPVSVAFASTFLGPQDIHGLALAVHAHLPRGAGGGKARSEPPERCPPWEATPTLTDRDPRLAAARPQHAPAPESPYLPPRRTPGPVRGSCGRPSPPVAPAGTAHQARPAGGTGQTQEGLGHVVAQGQVDPAAVHSGLGPAGLQHLPAQVPSGAQQRPGPPPPALELPTDGVPEAGQRVPG